MEVQGQQLILPPGFANATTPINATPQCGAYLQTAVFTVSGSDAVQIAFPEPFSWTQSTAWVPDVDGVVFTCQIPGIYNISVNQTLTLQNTAEVSNPTVYMAMSVVDANNAEIDQVYTNTLMVPVTVAAITVSTSFSNIINANVGTTLQIAIDSPSGNITMSSGDNSGNYQALTFNLIAQGVYGNIVP